MMPPAPPPSAIKPSANYKPSITKRPNPQPPAAAVAPPPPKREMKGPDVNIADLLKTVNEGVKFAPPDSKSVTHTPPVKKGGSTGKNSVSIKL
jgi:hypothetical protein